MSLPSVETLPVSPNQSSAVTEVESIQRPRETMPTSLTNSKLVPFCRICAFPLGRRHRPSHVQTPDRFIAFTLPLDCEAIPELTPRRSLFGDDRRNSGAPVPPEADLSVLPMVPPADPACPIAIRLPTDNVSGTHRINAHTLFICIIPRSFQRRKSRTSRAQ